MITASNKAQRVTGVIIGLFFLGTTLAFAPSASYGFFHEDFGREFAVNGAKDVLGARQDKAAEKKQKAQEERQRNEERQKQAGERKLKQEREKSQRKQAQTKVKGAQDQKSQESVFAKFFKNVGKGIGGVADFLWPFDGKADKAKETKVAQKASPLPSPKASPSPGTETSELTVETASNEIPVVVASSNIFSSLTVTGNTTLGDATSDLLILKALLGSDIQVAKNKEYNLGTGGDRFKSGYFSDNVFIGDENRLGSTGFSVKGSAYIETRSGGSIYLQPDSNTVYVGGGGKTGHLEVSNNLKVLGIFTIPSGASTAFDSVDITPATNIDALDIIGTNMTTADLIDLDATASTTGDAIDITYANTRTSGAAIKITDDSTSTSSDALIQIDVSSTPDTNTIDLDYAAAFTGNAFSYDNTGNAIWTGNVIDVDTGTGDASGDVFNVTIEAGATDVQTIVVANAAISDQAGWLMKVDTTAAFTSNMFDIDLGAQASTGDIVNVSMGSTNIAGGVLVVADAGGARTDALIDITSASTGDGTDASALLQLNATGVLLSGSNILDINRTGAASNAIDITTLTTASAGNLIDLNFGAILDTGDAVNIALGTTATGTQALVVTAANASTVDGWVLAADNTADSIWTGDMINIRTGTGDASGDIIDITMETGATDAQAIVVANAAASDQAGWLMKVDTTGIFTSNMFDIDLGAQASTGDIVNVSMGSTNIAGGVLVVADAGGARTDALIDITSASTGSAADAAAIFQINSTGDLDDLANVFDINMSGGTGANVIDITTLTTLTTGNMIDLNFGAIADTGDAINIAVGATAVAAQALVVTDGTIKTADLISITASGATVATGIDAVSIAMTSGDGTDTTQSALNIAITPGGTAAGDIMNAINIANITDAGTTNGIRIGSAFDNDIDFIDTTAVVSVGADGSADQLDVNAELTIHLDGGAVTTAALCGNQAGGDVADTLNVLISDCSGAPVSDYAELYPTKADVEFGEVVATTSEMVQTKKVVDDKIVVGEFVLLPKLGKSTKPYQSNVVGVTSNNYGDFSSVGHGLVNDVDNPLPVALSGRVSVKVTNEGGAIREGDYLTTSSTPGHVMRATKAGPVVGMALDGFSGEQGTVLVFVRNAWYDPVAEQKRAVLAALGLGSGSVLGTSSAASDSATSTAAATGETGALVGPAADGSLGVLEEAVDLKVHGLLTASNLRVTTAAEFAGTLTVKGLATFEGDLVVKGAFSTGSLDLSGALTRTMTAASDLSAGDPVVVTGANTVARAGGPSANVVGLAATSAGSGSAVKVAVAGTVGGYSGLSVGARYYVGSGGVVTTAPGGDKAVHIGIAISGSEMIVQIFESVAPPTPAVVDTATVEPAPEVTVTSDSTAGGTTGGTTTSTPTPAPSPLPSSGPSASPEPTPTPTPTPTPVVEVTPSPSPAP